MVRTLNPLLYSTSKSSTSFNITAKATRLFGQTFLIVVSIWRILPKEVSSMSPASNSIESLQPVISKSTFVGHGSVITVSSHSTKILGSGKVTTFPSESV